MSFGLHPIVLAAIIGLVLAITTAVLFFRVRSMIARVGLTLLTALLLVPSGLVLVGLNPWLVDVRFRAYRSFCKDIELGMTRNEVMTLMRSHYPAGGPRGLPKVMEDSPQRLGFFMNPESSREPNCEGIFLSMTSDRVTAISYVTAIANFYRREGYPKVGVRVSGFDGGPATPDDFRFLIEEGDQQPPE